MQPLLLAAIFVSVVIAAGVFAVSSFFSADATSTTTVVGQTAARQNATEQTVALRVDNMYCASCPYMVKRALEDTIGVIAADVSFREKRARVTYDPNKTEVADLIKATSEMGYPSRLVSN